MSDVSTVRLLINDTGQTNQVFTNTEIGTFLTIEGGVVKRAAAQALDTIADNEVLVAKVIQTSDGKSTDGAKVADSLRKRAQSLRDQADIDIANDDDGGYVFDIIESEATMIELAERGW